MKGATSVMAVKTDRNDARAIAQAMRVGSYTAVHVKTAESQELRLLLTNRKALQTSRVALENEIRGTSRHRPQSRSRVGGSIRAPVIELTVDRPRLHSMMRPMLVERQALRLQFDALQDAGLTVTVAAEGKPSPF